MKLAIISGASEINKAIASIANRGAKLDESIQQAGLSVLAHASEHGDTTLCDKLVQALPKGARKLALVEWMLAYGQIAKLDASAKEAIAAGRVFKLDRTRKLDMESAAAKEWHEFRKEAAISTAFDAQAAVSSLLKRLQGATEGGLTITGRTEALAQAQALVAALATVPADAAQALL